MRRLHEMLDEANGSDRIAELNKLHSDRAKRHEGAGHYGEVLEEQLGAIASDKLVIKDPRAAYTARSEARAITEEHQAVTTAESPKH